MPFIANEKLGENVTVVEHLRCLGSVSVNQRDFWTSNGIGSWKYHYCIKMKENNARFLFCWS